MQQTDILGKVFLFIFVLCCALLVLFSLIATPNQAMAEENDMGAIGAKLADPLGELWSINFNLELLKTYDGDINKGDPKLGSDTIFQPVMAIPLAGEGESEFRLITRPIIPLIFSQPVPTGFDEFDHKTGIGDMQLPLVFSVPNKYAGNWILGAGPVGMFPTATEDELGKDQWAAGTAVALGYKTKKWTGVLFHNHFWKIGESGQDENTPDINQGSLLYQFIYNLPDAWQVGTNPTITYDIQASSGNKWNVPVGLFVGKTTKIGKVPVNIKAGVEYSVVSQEDFGKLFAFRLQVTPVIPRMIKEPLFGK
ncbi:MAG: hypothetical protein JRE16_03280 [Deltaproteobacteria bacterium]|jgi:hypothetical protein|nr:hypothetical protein [Deltaproteobacteria bacterium]